MNNLGYGQLSNPNRSLKLVLMSVRNYQKLFLQYFHYISQRFYRILFLESISSNIEGGWSHLDYTIIFVDFIPYIIYYILEIL